MTALAGLPLYMDLASAMGTGESIEKHLHIKQQGWTDRQTLLSLIMMNLAGGDCVEDLRKLEGDTGFCQVLRRLEQWGMKRRERRESDRRWRKERSRTVPSASSVLYFGIYRRFTMRNSTRGARKARRLFLFRMSICEDWQR